MKLSFQDYISIKIHQTDLDLTSYIKSKLEPYNLAPEQNLVMMLLWEKDGLTQNQLAKALNKDKTNIARMVSNLEGKGFLNRSKCPNDQRSMEIYLTSCGKELGNQVIPILENFNKVVCKGISTEELKEMERLLHLMNHNITSRQ
ncbi:MarR family winged helix-turn-helix transcriptional regulator [Salipaludibacillus sp. CF4.18]|uniref:MarR family winged helix-turn-helix transcriptional regulator n=1 Tax=Salipaludibacillus sp. CF4.18 TaxID=3373081 RepID=UPI003EE4596C